MTLRGLIEAVERGDSRSDIALAAIGTGGGWEPPTIGGIRADQWQNILDAHDGSLDAVKRLHDAMLPGWDWSAGCVAGLCDAGVCKIGVEDAFFLARSDNPARAFLLAILRALEGEP